MNSGEQPSFGQLLKGLRAEAGLTQEALAERAGLSVRAIQDLERGAAQPLKGTVRRLIDALAPDAAARAQFERAGGPAPRRRTLPAPAAGDAAQPPLEIPYTALPAQLTALIGRTRELDHIHRLLTRPEGRLLTVTGPGGIGKTRLAVEAASRLRGAYPDGVVFVALASIQESALVPAAVAQALGVREATGRSLGEAIAEYIGRRRLLLVLDNCEHLPAAAHRVYELLAACPHLGVLATSRTPLHLRGEQIFPLAPLALPPDAPGTAEETLQASPAVALFAERATAIDPDFALTEADAAAVAAICRRLDGLPLAIELAAAHCKYLSPRTLLARLAPSLPILTGGARDLPARQRTLRSAIAWSYDLLPAEVQRVFRCLAVCAGGCAMDTAAAICQVDPTVPGAILGHLDTLVEASLLLPVRGRESEPRFTMLETIREFGREMLAAQGELAGAQARHAAHFRDLAVAAAPHLTGPRATVWLDRLDAEHDNLRAALAWAVAAGEAELALRTAGALWRFWYVRSHLTEGRQRLAAALAMPGSADVPAAVRARALFSAGVQAIAQGDAGDTAALVEEALALYRRIDDRRGIVSSLTLLAMAARRSGEFGRAVTLLEESIALARAEGTSAGMATNLTNLGLIARDTADFARAADLHTEALGIFRERQDRWGIAISLTYLGEVTQLQGGEAAAALFKEGLALHRQMGHKQGMAACLEGLAMAAGAGGTLETAARLFGAAAAIREALVYPPALADRVRRQRRIEDLKAALNATATGAPDPDPTPFDRAWAAGMRLPVEAAIAEALAIGEATADRAAGR